jgi:biotin-independent malonate decarboxylase gamma subunit
VKISSTERGRLWLTRLSGGSVVAALDTPSILTGDIGLGGGCVASALGIAIVRDADSLLPRAANGELGLEQAWTLAECLQQFIAEEEHKDAKRPIIAIVDTPGQAFGRIEEQRCISIAAAAVVDAYAKARRRGHIVLTLIVGQAMSGSFLAHGFQSDHIFALASDGVMMHVMSPQSIARITRRSVATVEKLSTSVLPMSYSIADAYRLGIVNTLIHGVCVEAPTVEDLNDVRAHLAEALSTPRREGSISSDVSDNISRKATETVRRDMRDQWLAFDKLRAGSRMRT